MHATQPTLQLQHPGWLGALLGVVGGVVLTLLVLLALNRVDLTVNPPTTTGLSPAAVTEEFQEHFAREHAAELTVR